MKIINLLTEDLNELGLETANQKISSAATSINSSKLPAIYNLVNFNEGDTVLDYGGGRFDNAVLYLKDKGVTLLVYDPYNRSAEHNKDVMAELKKNGGADAVVCSNVLNVIAEPAARMAVLKNIYNLCKTGKPVYITVYEGNKSGQGAETKAGYQLNKSTADYLGEIQKVFPNAQRKGKLIKASK